MEVIKAGQPADVFGVYDVSTPNRHSASPAAGAAGAAIYNDLGTGTSHTTGRGRRARSLRNLPLRRRRSLRGPPAHQPPSQSVRVRTHLEKRRAGAQRNL